MPAIPFQVEVVEPVRGFVLARQLEPGRFRLKPSSTLDGRPVMAMTQPPARVPDTALRDDLFLFQFREREDAKRFKIGAIVHLADAQVAGP